MPDDCFRESLGDRVPSNHRRCGSKRPIGKKDCDRQPGALPREPVRLWEPPEPKEVGKSNNLPRSMRPDAALSHPRRSASGKKSLEPLSRRYDYGRNTPNDGRPRDGVDRSLRSFWNSLPLGANAYDDHSRAAHGEHLRSKRRTHRCPAASTRSFAFPRPNPSSLDTLPSSCLRIRGSIRPRPRSAKYRIPLVSSLEKNTKAKKLSVYDS